MPELTESQIQKAVFAHLRERALPGVLFFHIPNNPRGRRASGFTKGLPDVCCVREGKFYGLELKTEKGKASEEQIEIVNRVASAGGYAVIAHGLDRALKCLEVWGIIR